MTEAVGLLNRCHTLGIDLAVSPDGNLTWEADTDPPAELLAALSQHKAELLAIISAPARPLPPAQPSATSADEPRNQSEADALLAELREEVARIERKDFRGQLPAPLKNVLADALAVAESYIVNHTMEARRGWDAMELLRGMRKTVRRWVENCKPTNIGKTRP